MEKEFRLALQLDSRSPGPRTVLAKWLAYTGHHEEAIREARQALNMNPDAPWLNTALGNFLIYAGRLEEGEAQIRKTLAITLNDGSAHNALGLLLWSLKKYDEAMAEFVRSSGLAFGVATIDEKARDAFRKEGLAGYAQVFLDFNGEREKMLHGGGWLPPSNWTDPYMIAGDFDKAFQRLEQACDERDPNVLIAIVHPYYRELWADPRFEKILRRVGLNGYLVERMQPFRGENTIR